MSSSDFEPNLKFSSIILNKKTTSDANSLVVGETNAFGESEELNPWVLRYDINCLAHVVVNALSPRGLGSRRGLCPMST
jgi:hypothetical protein